MSTATDDRRERERELGRGYWESATVLFDS